MTPPAAPSRALLRALAAGVVFLVLAAPAQATDPEVDNFDARPKGADAVPAAVKRAGDRLRARLGRFGALSLDERTGTVRSVGRLDGFLTGPSGRDAAAIALGYVRNHAGSFGVDATDLDGLRLVDQDFVDGVEHLAWEQRYRGIPAADAGLQAAVTGSGRLLNVTGPPASDLAVRSIEPSVGAADAYAAARHSGGDPRPNVDVAARDGGAEQATRFSDGGRASLTLYRAGAGHRLAWRLLAPVSSTGVYDVLVDARSGEPVRRANRVKFAVPAEVFRYNPATGPQQSEDFAPWLTSGTKLEGPNAHAFLDVHDTVGPQPSGFQLTPEAGSDIAPVSGGYEFPLTTVPSYGGLPESDGCPGTSTSFPSSICTWDPRPGGANSWRANQEQSATQLFYLLNTFHDHLRNDANIAFTDGEFRTTDKPLGDPNMDAAADASDPVIAQALDGADKASGLPDAAHANNASFLTLPDGYPGLMQIHLWTPPLGGYDGANDASMVFHEYTHGLSGRLVTDAGGFEALSSAQSGAMSEGWSDFYALDYLAEEGLQSDTPGTADVRFGRYFDNATGAVDALVRIQSIDCVESSPSPSPPCRAAAGAAGAGAFTYGDFGQINLAGPQVHDDGEIWGQTLWSLRAALIAEHDEAAGIARARRYITQAMRLCPPEPSFLDMRNAILQASTDETDDALMWTVFAERGMGWSATTNGSDDPAPSAAFDLPPAATTQDATAVEQTTTTLNGLIDPNGQPTSYRFEFGETLSYGGATSLGSIGGDEPVAVAATITGLQPGTTYHYRVVALRGTVQMAGQDRTFTTGAAPPPPPPPPPPPLPPPVVAKLTALMDAKLSASRKGFFKVRVLFGDATPSGNALFTVANGERRRLARATTPVRVGRTVTKTLRLSKKGRKAIKPGRSKLVRLQLRLPSGEKFEKFLKLKRKRR